jgi:hypothetical protein
MVAGNIPYYVKLAVLGFLFVLVVLWIGRLLLRFLISERHLAIDAEERVTMVMTYLALTKEGSLDQGDRGIVLASLFRSGTDGIVKDDGIGPDTAITGLIAKTLDRLAGGKP